MNEPTDIAGLLSLDDHVFMAWMGYPQRCERGSQEANCSCGDSDCMNMAFGYPHCRACDEHHRPPECPIDELGRALDPYGKPWPDSERVGVREAMDLT